MNLLTPQTVLWFGAQILQLAVLVCMYRRRIQSYYPAFFYYIVVEAVSDPFLALARGRWDYTYYFGYWTTVCLTTALSFFVLQEIFRDAFRPFEALRDLSTILFRWSALVLLLVAGMSAVTMSNANNDSITATIFLVDRNVKVMLCGLVFFLLMFSEYLGISRRHLLFGVAVGFGFFSAIHMLVATAMSHQTVLSRSALGLINSGAYVIACLIWLGYIANRNTLLAGEKAAEPKGAVLNEALTDARNQVPPESMLDTMDELVARLFKHGDHNPLTTK